jgi:hypothetical protein
MEGLAISLAMLAGPAYAAAAATLVWLVWRRRRPGPRPPSPWGLVLMLAAPWTLVAWGTAVVEAGLDPRPRGWSVAVLHLLVLPVLGVLGWMLSRWRSAPIPAWVCFLAALCGTGMAWLLGMLALAGDSL